MKMPSLKQLNLSIDGSGFLYNKALLYFIFAISFGNFMLEMIAGDMYFIIVYLLVGFLTTFFNKNMIVVLLMSCIFANILKYGAQSVEGFEDEGFEEGLDSSMNDASKNKVTAIDRDTFTDRELDSMKYKESEKMIENQNLLLKNMKDFKPFLDTIQGITKSFSTSSSTSSSTEKE